MKVEWIKHRDLPVFIESPLFSSGAPLPISRRRALSHYYNPRAGAEDVVLILIYEKHELLGYLGLIPDLLFIQDQKERVAWMSCIWVSPAARGKGIAKQLLKEGYDACEGRLIATEFTGPARHLYEKTGYFNSLLTLNGRRFYLRANFNTLLPAKKSLFNRFSFILKTVDTFINFFNDLRLNFYSFQLPASLQFKALPSLTESHQDFLTSFTNKTYPRRGLAELQWLTQNPWLGNDKADKQDQARYVFSVFSEQFSQQWYVLTDRDKTVGLFLFSIRNQQLKIPYYFVQPAYHEVAAQFIIREMIQQKIYWLTTYHSALCQVLQTLTTPFYYHKAFDREYLLSKTFNLAYSDPQASFQDGDGDCGFT